MQYTTSLAFLTITILYSITLNILYFTKTHIKTKETAIFGAMVSTNLVGVILEILCIISLMLLGADNIISIIINKMFLLYFLVILLLFSQYILNTAILNKNKEQIHIKIIRVLMYILFVVGVALVLLLEINLYSENGITYSYGPAVSVIYTLSAFVSTGCIAYLLINIKSIMKKRNVPIIAFVVLMGITAVVQQLNPAITLATSMETLVIFLMYHTIENPDVKLIRELEMAKEQSEKANKAKTDFLSNMSHEIRTPLNAIVGFSDCIVESNDLGEAKENAKDIINAGQTLLEIVNGILDISKIETGKLEIVNTRYNAKEVFSELATLITPRMNDKHLDFTYYIAPDIPNVLFGDVTNIKKVVTNLLSNACKYTSQGFVRYEVNCVRIKDYLRLIISVEDSGRGIKKENIDKMFTKFQRLEEDRNTTIEGTGLGLAITKQLVELMGGKIIVHSIYGEGSKFTVVLNQRISEKKPIKQDANNNSLDLSNVKILIVDDAPMNLKVASKVLEKYNANMIDTCESGFECIDKINNGNTYDLILLDDMMPKMSGVITLKKLKENSNFNIPTIALTANAISGMKEAYLKEGFNGFLAKPIVREELERVLTEVLETGQAKDEYEKTGSLENVDNKIIPVEGNIEKELGEQLDLSTKEEIDNKEKTIMMEPVTEPIEEVVDVIPVVDIDIPEKKDKTDYLKENGVDLSSALELLGDMEMYNSTIQDFSNELENKWYKINNYKSISDMEDYAIEVHSLKSDCKYLGFTKLAELAYQHEINSKENNIDFVNNNFASLEEEYNRVLDIVNNYVNNN